MQTFDKLRKLSLQSATMREWFVRYDSLVLGVTQIYLGQCVACAVCQLIQTKVVLWKKFKKGKHNNNLMNKNQSIIWLDFYEISIEKLIKIEFIGHLRKKWNHFQKTGK